MTLIDMRHTLNPADLRLKIASALRDASGLRDTEEFWRRLADAALAAIQPEVDATNQALYQSRLDLLNTQDQLRGVERVRDQQFQRANENAALARLNHIHCRPATGGSET